MVVKVRLENYDWGFELPPNGQASWDQAKLAVLMDIRDELQRLNGLLHCQNFQDIPTLLRSIDRKTIKRIARKAAAIGKRQ